MTGQSHEEMTVRDKVSILPISQATVATFSDLYFRLTFLFFIQAGSKRVLSPRQGELIAQEGDLLIFPPGSSFTLENRPLTDRDYRAVGVSFTDDLIEQVFGGGHASRPEDDVQLVRSVPSHPGALLPIIQDTLNNQDLPEPILRHRLLEPLIWLRENGCSVSIRGEEQPLSKVRRLIETDLARSWRSSDVAGHLAMSEATMRRWLSKSGQSFAKILVNTRLEYGLSQLQSTGKPVSEISLNCGFKTPSHFSDAFKKRFGIRPKDIRSSEN